MSVMYMRDKDGNLIPVPTIRGGKGETGDQGPTGPQGDAYVLTEEDKAQIAADVAASLSQIEAPEIVSSLEEMTDTTKHYVLDGYIYHSKQVATEGGTTSPNVLDTSVVSLNTRISGTSGSTSEQNGGFVTDFIAVPDISAVTPYYARLNWELTSGKENKIVFFDASQARLGCNIAEIGTNTVVSDGSTVIDLRTIATSGAAEPSDWSAVAYMRIQVMLDITAATTLTSADVTGKEITLDVNNVVIEPTVTTEWVNSGISYAPTFKTDLIGVLGENNVVYLSTNLPAGTYTLKYGDDYADVGSITVA